MLDSLRKEDQIKDEQLDKLFEESKSQDLPAYTGEGKDDTNLVIYSIKYKEGDPNQRFSSSKWQVFGRSDKYRNKVLVSFGTGTKAEKQLADILEFSKMYPEAQWISFEEPALWKGKAIHVSGTFSVWNDLVIVKRPKFAEPKKDKDQTPNDFLQELEKLKEK